MESLILYPELRLSLAREERVAAVFGRIRAELPAAATVSDADTLLQMAEDGALREKRILVFCVLDAFGMNDCAQAMRRVFRMHSDALDGSVAAFIVDGESELYTKDVARDFAFDMNSAGCMLMSKCLAEGTGSLLNYELRAEKENCSLYEAYLRAVTWLSGRLGSFEAPRAGTGSVQSGSETSARRDVPKVLCVHAGDVRTSNTMHLWSMVKEELQENADINEICLRDGALPDCRGCGVKSCTYFSESRGCYYGGVMVDSVYPALLDCDALVILAPNYNDALSANLTAMINRMTALSSKEEFMDKYLFALVVSGYSGSDLLMRQMIGALGMNRYFIIPPRFALHKTAYHPGDLAGVPGVLDEAASFAAHIRGSL